MIHGTAVVENPSTIGCGTKVWHFVHIRKGAIIGKNCNIGKGAYIDTEVVIGNNVKIQNNVNIYDATIEDDVFLGPNMTFTNDLYPRASFWDRSQVQRTLVRRGASIGANATILTGLVIGNYSLIGAGSVVTKDVPANSIFYGVPASLRGFVCECGTKLSTIKEIRSSNQMKCMNCVL